MKTIVGDTAESSITRGVIGAGGAEASRNSRIQSGESVKVILLRNDIVSARRCHHRITTVGTPGVPYQARMSEPDGVTHLVQNGFLDIGGGETTLDKSVDEDVGIEKTAGRILITCARCGVGGNGYSEGSPGASTGGGDPLRATGYEKYFSIGGVVVVVAPSWKLRRRKGLVCLNDHMRTTDITPRGGGVLGGAGELGGGDSVTSLIFNGHHQLAGVPFGGVLYGTPAAIGLLVACGTRAGIPGHGPAAAKKFIGRSGGRIIKRNKESAEKTA